MIVDCDRCEVRDTACGDCVIGVLMDVPEIDRPIPYLPVELPGDDVRPRERPAGRVGVGPAPEAGAATGGPSGEPVEFAEPERRALQVLADHGLIPHLRLVEPAARPAAAADLPVLPVPAAGRDLPHRDVG